MVDGNGNIIKPNQDGTVPKKIAHRRAADMVMEPNQGNSPQATKKWTTQANLKSCCEQQTSLSQMFGIGVAVFHRNRYL